jgi:uncharacterized protein DUF2190
MDYTPAGGHPAALSFTASAAITAGQLVMLTGADAVGPANAAGATYIGVAGADAAVGEGVTVLCGSGVLHETTAPAAIAAGVPVGTAANGALAAPGGANVGMSVRAAAAGQACRWLAYR